MQVRDIPVVTVSYNAPHLLRGLLGSLRRFYDNPVHVVDGSDDAHFGAISAVLAEFDGVHLHAHGYNIHHGPGLAWAFEHLPLGARTLVVDSDIVVLRHGFLEAMDEALEPFHYGVGAVVQVNEEGFDVPYACGAVPYLHPALMLCNVSVVKRWPLPIKHGAPMIGAMLALYKAGQSDLLQELAWARGDVIEHGVQKLYVDHLGRGTVSHSGGYNLDEWMAGMRARSSQSASGRFNPQDLLSLIPDTALRIAEVGCSAGGLVQALKAQRPALHCRGFERDPKAAPLARAHCDEALHLDIEAQDSNFWRDQSDRDCWVFNKTLEQLREPWRLLARIRESLPAGGSVVVRVSNAQHWSVQARLASGDFRYDAAGLLDRNHLRWFTRTTLIEMITTAGFRLEAGLQRLGDEPQWEPLREPTVAAIRQVALATGRDADAAVRDALPLEYLLRAVPA